MSTPYVLHYAPDNASLIIRLALEELGVPYRTKLVDRRVSEQTSVAYRALNPAGRIPTLETPDGPISETGAILLWLSDRHGGLLPAANTPDRAAALNWLFFVSNTLHADVAKLFYVTRYGPPQCHDALTSALRDRVSGHLAILDQDVVARLPHWFGGENPSALDFYVAAILRWLQLYPASGRGWLKISAFPRLAAICAGLETRDSVAELCSAEGMAPHPFTKPDYPNPPEGSSL